MHRVFLPPLELISKEMYQQASNTLARALPLFTCFNADDQPKYQLAFELLHEAAATYHRSGARIKSHEIRVLTFEKYKHLGEALVAYGKNFSGNSDSYYVRALEYYEKALTQLIAPVGERPKRDWNMQQIDLRFKILELFTQLYRSSPWLNQRYVDYIKKHSVRALIETLLPGTQKSHFQTLLKSYLGSPNLDTEQAASSSLATLYCDDEAKYKVPYIGKLPPQSGLSPVSFDFAMEERKEEQKYSPPVKIRR